MLQAISLFSASVCKESTTGGIFSVSVRKLVAISSPTPENEPVIAADVRDLRVIVLHQCHYQEVKELIFKALWHN